MAELIETENRVNFAIPEHEDPTRSILLLTEPHGMTAEAIRAIRTRLIAQHVRMGRRALAICSVAPSAQASFVAANLAVALQRRGMKVGLVDADIYGPSQPRLMDSEGVKPEARGSKLAPVPNAYGVPMLSTGQIAAPGQAIAWRRRMRPVARPQHALGCTADQLAR